MAAPSFRPQGDDYQKFKENLASTLMCDPDGPMRYVESLDEEVGTYLDPMEHMVHPNTRKKGRLDYHVPFGKRGIYKPEWLPKKHLFKIQHSLRTDNEGYVICNGKSQILSRGYVPVLESDGKYHSRKQIVGYRPCSARAVNRSGFCRNHGGALHPGNKKLSAQSNVKIPENRVEQLDRVQKFMQGFLKFEDLTDEEVMGGFIYNDQGRPISTTKLGDTIHQGLVKELFKRMNHFMAMKLPNMLARIAWVAESDVVEPETQLKAAVWMAERVMGKNPEVILTGKAELPYESILQKVEGGSREEYRRQVALESGQNALGPVSSDTGTQAPNSYGQIIDADLDGYEPDGPIDSGEADPDGEDDSEFDGDFGPGGPNVSSDREGTVFDGSVGIHNDPEDRHDSGIVEDSGPGPNGINMDGAYGRQDDAEKRIADAKAFRDRIKKERNKRFAARATGASSVNEISWQIEFRQIINKALVEQWGKKGYIRIFRAKLVPPEALTEAKLDRIGQKQDLMADGRN